MEDESEFQSVFCPKCGGTDVVAEKNEGDWAFLKMHTDCNIAEIIIEETVSRSNYKVSPYVVHQQSLLRYFRLLAIARGELANLLTEEDWNALANINPTDFWGDDYGIAGELWSAYGGDLKSGTPEFELYSKLSKLTVFHDYAIKDYLEYLFRRGPASRAYKACGAYLEDELTPLADQ